MKGKVTIRVSTPRESFEVELKNKVTILKGDSGIGKTEFFTTLWNCYVNNNVRRIVSLQLEGCNGVWFPYEKDWYTYLDKYSGYIAVVDSSNDNVLKYSDLADVIRRSDNYFLLITRRSLNSMGLSDKDDVGVITLVSNIENTILGSGNSTTYCINKSVEMKEGYNYG